MAEMATSFAPESARANIVQVSRSDSHPSAALCTRVMIASSVRLLREGLAASLHGRDGVVVIGAVSLDAADMCRIAVAAPDVVVVDVGRTDAVTVARLLRSARVEAKLVAFALNESDGDVFACAAAGFSNYVPRESGADDLYRALVDAVDGRMQCAPHITAAIFRRLAELLGRADPRASLPALTSRENEILTLASAGRSNKEIARALAISGATVKNHMHSILQKLQVTRRGQAIARLRAGAAAD
jgi:two-component system nitrate/nitrite response regulator NarL